MMEGMTLLQVADFCDVSESTLRRWASKDPAPGEPARMAGDRAKMADARTKLDEGQRTKKPARLSQEEIGAILRAGGRPGLAALLEDNALRSTVADLPDKRIAEITVHALRCAGVLRQPPTAARRRFVAEVEARARATKTTTSVLYAQAYRTLERETGVNLEAIRAAEGFATTVEAADYNGYCERLLAIVQEWGRAEFGQGVLQLVEARRDS